MKFTTLLQNILSIFYPRSCVSCRDALQQHEKLLCTNCLLHLPETNYHLDKENPLQLLFRGRVPIENIAALLFYKKGNQVQHILHALKYNGNQEIGEFLGHYYGLQLSKEDNYQQIDLILPIPLHPKKLKNRGYNQSECIAKGLSRSMAIPYRTDILIRTVFTETQTKKSRFNRWKNVEEVFKVVEEDEIAGKHLLLCDDVLTTGATLEAAISKTLDAGASHISIITLAVAH